MHLGTVRPIFGLGIETLRLLTPDLLRLSLTEPGKSLS